ncbi:MAG TPA: hypothetical protein VN174_02355 [Candidatus Methanoperedens sp.]|nr:hypothetical protein [Candidatus Methanoperedens sp.]
MINIFHGDHTSQSYSAFSETLKTYSKHEKFHQNNKTLEIDSLDRFLNTPSLFLETKVVILESIFSLPKTQLDKISELIKVHPDNDYLIWHDKKIEATKIKLFPNANIKVFTLPELLFSCLNSIKPNNKTDFSRKYQELIQNLPIELILFWFKNSLRRQLTTYSKFSENNLKNAYLNLIELDKKSKTGNLFEPKEIAIERIIFSLLDS